MYYMYLLRCKYLYLFKKKNCIWLFEGDIIFIIIKKKLLKLDIFMMLI